ncbi:MAG: MoaD/ThiS family protein [Candidatus Helarchaeota archaeon]|nr:MoaD/ThiS family protein [Candidatus Helarchaeota archaeon]
MSKSTNLIYKTIQVKKKKTVSDLLKELNIKDNFFAILVNGKRAVMNQVLVPEDKILVLPKIKGG